MQHSSLKYISVIPDAVHCYNPTTAVHDPVLNIERGEDEVNGTFYSINLLLTKVLNYADALVIFVK